MFSRTIGVAIWIASAISLALAQGFTGTISGTVKDESGSVLQGAQVTAKHTETGLTRTAVTDTSGSYSIPSLPVGAYEISAQQVGFKVELVRGIELVVAQQAVVNVTLQVGNVEQRVTVTGEAPLVNTTLASTSGLINENQIKDMPLNGRSFDQLLTLNAGTTNNSTNVLNGSWTGFSVDGKRTEANRFTINGIDYVGGNSTGLWASPSGVSGMLLGVEAVREYNVLQHSYGAEYGKRSGGQISIVTTSGTNGLHGDLFEFLRNSAFDARNFFDATIGTPPFKRHQFGGALGGPLKKDRMFLFGNYEAFEQRLALSNVAEVPDAQARLGLLPCNVIGAAASPCPASGYAPVPNLKQGILPYANYFWPAPNGPELLTNGQPSGFAYNYSNPGQIVHEHFGLARFDYVISSKDSFSANYTIDDGDKFVPQPDPNFALLVTQRPQTLSLQETRVFSAAVVNTLTAGYSRSFTTAQQPPTVQIPPNLAFLSGTAAGTIVLGGSPIAVVTPPFTPAQGQGYSQQARNNYSWADDLHLIKGRHTVSAGGWIQRVQQNSAGATIGSAGAVGYPGIMAFLQDAPSLTILQRNPIPVGYRSLGAAWYVQDEMKIRRNLTLRLGLRDEMTDGWNEVAGRCANYFFDANGLIQTNPHIGSSCLAQNNAKALWQPRVGLVWDPTGKGDWAVRAGFGIHNDLLDNLSIRTHPNPPYNARESFAATPLLSLIPFQKEVALPPNCSPAQGRPCSIYQPAAIDPNMFTPTVQEWSFTVERQLGNDMMLRVGYVGSQSYHTTLTENENSDPPQVCQNPQGCRSGGVLPLSQTAMVPQGTYYMPSKPPVTVNGLTLTQRPNPYVANTVSWVDQGTASYHALNVSLQKRASHGLAFKANYTFAKGIDLNSALLAPAGENEPAAVFTPYNLKLNRGLTAYIVQHQFNANFSYQFPFGNDGAGGLRNQLIGGWQWNGIFTTQDGFPFTALVGSNTSGTGDTSSNSDVPNWNPKFRGPVTLGTTDHWFDPQAF